MKQWHINSVALIALITLLTCSAYSQQSETTDLQRKVEALEKRVSELERIIEKLKENTPKQTYSQPAVEKWKEKRNWRKLKKGMTEQDVVEILGDPPNISTGFYLNMWYYGFGSVTFNTATRRVEGWTEP